ncbi:nodulin-related protein 2 [Primulina huaijiensis]|uniref:nodulin-related protein 2 n=1 Tax=Primulina huaijiensis TaxID=1492673 RepID=UPI003CC7530F
MDFLSDITKHDHDSKPKPTSDHPTNPVHAHHKRPSNSDLLNSAKVVADAAKSHLRHEPQKHEKGMVANAAADLLCGASEYGKLDDSKGMGKYVDKAEDYLRQYHTTHSTTTVVDSHGNKTTTTTTSATVTTDPEKDPATGGVGDYVKMAEDFLHKPSGGGGGAGAGDFMKMAGDFLKK